MRKALRWACKMKLEKIINKVSQIIAIGGLITLASGFAVKSNNLVKTGIGLTSCVALRGIYKQMEERDLLKRSSKMYYGQFYPSEINYKNN